jgi:hypothetical protein
VQHEHAHVRAGVARRDRLAVRPHAEDRVLGAGVELGDDRDPHRYVRSVRASSRLTYGRSARNARASAIASSRPYAFAAGTACRIGVASTTPIRHPRSRATADPVRVEPPAHPQAGEREQRAERVAVKRGHGPDLDERGLARDRRRAPARDRPRRVRGEPVGGLREAEPEPLGAREEAVEEPRRQDDVVVHDEQPVEPRRPSGRRTPGRRSVRRRGVPRGRQKPVQVLELPAPVDAARPQLDVVRRRAQLGLDVRPAAPRPGDGEDEDPAAVRQRRAAAPGDVEHGVGGGAGQRAAPADGAAAAREEVVAAARRRAQRLLDPAGAVGGEDRAVGAAEARAVERGTGEDPQLARDRRRRALRDVLAPRGAAAQPGGAGERRHPRVGARTAVVERGAGEPADAAAGGVQPRLPLLLVAVEAERLVEPADLLDRRPAHREVRAPRVRRVALLRPEVEERDRRALAPAEPRRVALEHRAHRSGQAAVAGVALGPADQRGQPPRSHRDVVVDEADELRRGGVQAGVARRVQAARRRVGHVARAVPAGRLAGRVRRPVVDHDEVRARGPRLLGEPAQRDVEVARTVLRGDDDCRVHRGPV